MVEYLIQDTTLDAIADAINAKTGGSSAMTPAQMVTAIGSISVGSGLNYTLETVNVTSDYPVVDRVFDNFIFIAQVASSPQKADRTALSTYFMEIVYINGHFAYVGKNAKVVATEGAQANYKDMNLSFVGFTVGATSITFTAMGANHVYLGEWNVLQIELPSDFPFFSFHSL